jgi:hypothetical protein
MEFLYFSSFFCLDGFRSGDPVADGSFEITFNEPGEYFYVCEPHASLGMRGKIIVEGDEDRADGDSSTPLRWSTILPIAILALFFSRRELSLIFLFSLIAISMPTSAEFVRTYSNCKLIDGRPEVRYQIHWTTNGTHIQIGLMANASGWIGFGLSTDGTMSSSGSGSDMIISWPGNVFDYSAFFHDKPTLDINQNVAYISVVQGDWKLCLFSFFSSF